VDGVPAPILRAVYLEPGEIEVEFVFRQKSLVLGAACSVAALTLWLERLLLLCVSATSSKGKTAWRCEHNASGAPRRAPDSEICRGGFPYSRSKRLALGTRL